MKFAVRPDWYWNGDPTTEPELSAEELDELWEKAGEDKYQSDKEEKEWTRT
jgi:hypothetical protein